MGTQVSRVYARISAIDNGVSRLAHVCLYLFRIMILCYSLRSKSGWKLGYV